MSIRKGIARAAPRSKAAGPKAGQILTLDNPSGWGLDAVGMSTDRAMKISTVSRCVEVLSNSFAVLPTYLMNENSHERLTEHRLGPLLWERPNEAMTAFDFNRLMMVNVVLKGNAYAWNRRDPRTGYVVERIPLPPDYVTVMVDPDGTVWYLYIAPRTGEMYKLDQEDVTHCKAYSKDGLEGISVLSRAAQTMSTAEAAEKYQTAVYSNGAQPCGVLTTDSDIGGVVEVKKADGTIEVISKKERLRREWEKIHRGPDNAFRLAVLDLGLRFQSISLSNNDLQFVESSEVRVADIARFFSVPLHMLYAGKESYASNEANSIDFVRYTLTPYVVQEEQENTYKLLLPSERAKGLRIKREMKMFLRGDTAAQAAWYEKLVQLGVYSVNDVRALEDMPDVPGGETRYASLNYIPLEAFDELSRLRAASRKISE